MSMSTPSTHERRPINLQDEMSKLKHDTKQNANLKRLPANVTIHKRPILHAAVPSPYAGANVPKVVYVSNRTPIMSAVKRVRKLLDGVEKRAVGEPKLVGRGAKEGLEALRDATDRAEKGKGKKEEVLVKGSGKAMTMAVKVGEWFKTKETERRCNVDVRTGSVSVVDDLVQVEDEAEDDNEAAPAVDEGEQREATAALEGGDTTMELLADTTTTRLDPEEPSKKDEEPTKENTEASTKSTASGTGAAVSKKKKKRGPKRKREIYDADDLPEARVRWIKTVEVAISLKS